MQLLSTALYAEGRTDVEFLCPLLRRLCIEWASKADDVVEVSDVLALDDAREDKALPREVRIEKAAQAADGAWLLLFIHADADGDARKALTYRVDPARQRLAGWLGPRRRSVAIVPVRSTDAWVLADTDAIRGAFGTTLPDKALGLDAGAAQRPDRLTDPKAALAAALRAARPRRRFESISPYLGLVAELASLDKLRKLDAFVALESELAEALRAINLLRAH